MHKTPRAGQINEQGGMQHFFLQKYQT